MEAFSGFLMFAIGLLCFYLAWRTVKKGLWVVRGFTCSREKNGSLFWAGVISYVVAGIFFWVMVILK